MYAVNLQLSRGSSSSLTVGPFQINHSQVEECQVAWRAAHVVQNILLVPIPIYMYKTLHIPCYIAIHAARSKKTDSKTHKTKTVAMN